MLIFHGHSLAPGVAIAAAARLELTFGLPQLALERQRHMGETLLRAGLDLPDPDQIIVVARTLPPGFLSNPLPGLEIVGAALADALAAASPLPCPVVGDIGDELINEVNEGDIIIVDGDRGRVYVAPDAQTLARYQGPGRRVRRFFLEPVHVEARRSGAGPAVPVLAEAADWDTLRAAVDAGADAVFVPQGGALWEDDNFLTAGEQQLRLRAIADITGGKGLFLQVPLERVALSALAQAASWGPVALVLSDAALAPEARAELDALEAELEECDIVYGRVALHALVDAGEAVPVDALPFLDGLFVLGGLPRDISYAALAIAAPAETADAVAALLDGGATRLLTVPAQVQAVKDAVRRS